MDPRDGTVAQGMFAMRTTGDRNAVLAAIRQAVHEVLFPRKDKQEAAETPPETPSGEADDHADA